MLIRHQWNTNIVVLESTQQAQSEMAGCIGEGKERATSESCKWAVTGYTANILLLKKKKKSFKERGEEGWKGCFEWWFIYLAVSVNSSCFHADYVLYCCHDDDGDDITFSVREEVRKAVRGKGRRQEKVRTYLLWTAPSLKEAPLKLQARTLPRLWKETDGGPSGESDKAPGYCNNCWEDGALRSARVSGAGLFSPPL